MNEFTIYPAIDLRKGRVVRLKQGDPGQETHFSDDPGATARQWAAAGAAWLHVVNLDGAFGEGTRLNQTALAEIIAACNARVRLQFGGGLRQLDQIEAVLQQGVARVVIGTAAIENETFAREALTRFGSQLAFALDAREGLLRTHGWQKGASVPVAEFADFLAAHGAQTVIYTDIGRDGMGAGVDWITAKELAARSGLQVIASGGVATLDDVKAVRLAGLSGVIIGRALYERRFTLGEALSC